MVQNKVKVASNRQGKKIKAFATFSASRWKNDTATFLKLIKSKIGRVEMTKIMEVARQMWSLVSQAYKEGAVVFKSLNNVLEVIII